MSILNKLTISSLLLSSTVFAQNDYPSPMQSINGINTLSHISMMSNYSKKNTFNIPVKIMRGPVLLTPYIVDNSGLFTVDLDNSTCEGLFYTAQTCDIKVNFNANEEQVYNNIEAELFLNDNVIIPLNYYTNRTFKIGSANDSKTLYSISDELMDGDTIQIEGTDYKVRFNSNNTPVVKKSSSSSSIYDLYTNRLKEKSVYSRTDRVNDILSIPTNMRHFRVDVDKNLLYRGSLSDTKNPDNFIHVKLEHATHGDIDNDGIRRVDAYISKEMLNFLKKQKQNGATISIASTGGWVQESFEVTLQQLGLNIDEFYNKETFNAESDKQIKSNTWLPSVFKKANKVGFSQKFRVLGNIDSQGRHNIMLDDQAHQRAMFKYSIDAKDFGMGPVKALTPQEESRNQLEVDRVISLIEDEVKIAEETLSRTSINDFIQANIETMSDNAEARDELNELLYDPRYSSENITDIYYSDSSASFLVEFGENALAFSNRDSSNGEYRGARLREQLEHTSYDNLYDLIYQNYNTKNNAFVIYASAPVKNALLSNTAEFSVKMRKQVLDGIKHLTIQGVNVLDLIGTKTNMLNTED